MKVSLAITLLILNCWLAKAQESKDSTQYIHGLPETGEVDTLQRSIEDRVPKDVLVEIPKDKIPSKLRKTLQKDDLYEGWDRFPVMQNRNTGIYTISIEEGQTVKTYGFNKNGKPVTFNEADNGEDQ